MWKVFQLGVALLPLIALRGYAQRSVDGFTLVQETLDSGGGYSGAEPYTNGGSFGQTIVGESSTENFSIVHGYLVGIPRPPLSSADELLVNGSFEDTEGTFVGDANGVMALLVGASQIPGWKTEAAELAWVDNSNTFGASTPFGTHSLDLTGYHDGLPYARVTQTIATVAGQKYQMSLSLGSNADYPGAGGQKSVSICAGSTSTTFTLIPSNTTGNQWRNYSFSFIANASETEVVIGGLIASGVYLGLDNVSIVEDRSPAQARAVELVVNGNFEEACAFVPDGNGVMTLLPDSTVIPGWTTTSGELGWCLNGNSIIPRSTYGSFYLDLTGYQDQPPYAGIAQNLATIQGLTYRLTFLLGSDEDRPSYRGPMTVGVSLGSVSQSFTFTPTGTGSQWHEVAMDFTAESPPTRLTITGISSGGGAYLGLDNISVSQAAAPESPRPTVVAVTPDTLKVRFPVEAGRTYAVESRAQLSIGDWVIVPGTTQSSVGAALEVSLPILNSLQHQFYRVRPVP